MKPNTVTHALEGAGFGSEPGCDSGVALLMQAAAHAVAEIRTFAQGQKGSGL